MAARHRVRLRQILSEAEGYLELGMPQHALDVFERVEEPSHFTSHAFFIQGEALKQLGRHQDAIAPLGRAAEIAPSNIQIWLALGWCYKRLRQFDLAVDAMEQAVLAE